MSYLPDDLKEQVKSGMKAAFKLETAQGKTKLEKLAQWLQKEHLSAATSLNPESRLSASALPPKCR